MKRSFKLAEICKQLDLPPYVLRYWETEFPALQGEGRGSGPSRTFTPEDLAVLRRIKQLLYDEGYTIAGAKKKIESEPAPRAETGAAPLFHETGDAAETSAATKASAVAVLDSAADERIEHLRRGIADALKEARAILNLLGRSSR